ncbi:16700_t:CDS:2, partial [Racocetra persica]
EQNDKEAIPEVLPEISAPNNNTDNNLLSKPPTSSVTQDKESRSHKKKLEAENIVQD